MLHVGPGGLMCVACWIRRVNVCCMLDQEG